MMWQRLSDTAIGVDRKQSRRASGWLAVVPVQIYIQDRKKGS